MAAVLQSVEAIHVATVLEDCVDQLAVLGRIMPVSFTQRKDAEEIVGDEITQLVDGQKQLENKYEEVLSKKQDIRGPGKTNQLKRADNQRDVMSVGGDLKNSMHVFARSLKQSPLTSDNMEKLQADRAFLERVLFETLMEVQQDGGFQSLREAVSREKERKARLQEIIHREEEGRKRVKQLQKQMLDVKKEKETEVQQRNEMIAHLKDQLQEMKAKTNMEGKYIKKCADVAVAQTQKKGNMTEKELKDEIDRLRQKIDDEIRVNSEIESYLRNHQTILEEKMEMWSEKHEKDVEQKDKELNILKASKAKDLERLNELTKLYAEYEQVVVEDRVEKEKARRKQEQEAEELKAATKLQSWFRGVMVRKGLGPYNKKKKKKGKKGKKSGKGKKKKK